MVGEQFYFILQNEYFQSGLVLLASVIVAQIVYRFMKGTIMKFVIKTQTYTDDALVNMMTVPIFYLIIFGGLYLSLRSLSLMQPYVGGINTVFFIVAVFLVVMAFSRLLSSGFSHWFKAQRGVQKTPKLITKIINGVVYLIGLLVIFNFFNIAVTPLLATLGLGALAVGLALQPTLSNFFAGLRILSDKPINVGDYVELDKNSGYVEDIGWNTTRIRTLHSTMVVVPNSKLADSIVVNSSLPKREVGVQVNCGVSYHSDLDKVERIVLDVARKVQKNTPGAVNSFQPFMRYNSFGDMNITFWVMLMAESYVDQHLLTHEFIKALETRFKKEKIKISGAPHVNKFTNS